MLGFFSVPKASDEAYFHIPCRFYFARIDREEFAFIVTSSVFACNRDLGRQLLVRQIELGVAYSIKVLLDELMLFF